MAARAPQINGIAYVELYVANAYQAAFFYRVALGFAPIACAGPKVGERDRVSVLLQQGSIRIMLTSGVRPESPVARHVHEHGDGVRDVAFLVDDAEAAFAIAIERGARAISGPVFTPGEAGGGGQLKATIAAPGDTVHSFVALDPIGATPWPGFQALADHATTVGIGLTEIDHVAVGLERGSLEHWVDFYQSVLGFRQSHSEMILTTRSGMNSKVVEDPEGRVRIPMVVTAGDGRTSQIDTFLACHRGAGAQHVAFATTNIIATIEALAERGVHCLSIPSTYYEELALRLPDLDAEDRTRFEAAGVLVDSESGHLLLQAFTEPLHHRSTLFVEVIERRGARGFGGRNIQALFEAVERDQSRRGQPIADTGVEPAGLSHVSC